MPKLTDPSTRAPLHERGGAAPHEHGGEAPLRERGGEAPLHERGGEAPHEHGGERLAEGAELAPPGAALMGWLRWALLACAAFLAVAMWWSYAAAQQPSDVPGSQASRMYRCPMHPQIVTSAPGECPICHMTLEPFTPAPAPPRTEGAPLGTTTITLELDRVQAIGVRTALVGEREQARSVRASAVIAPTETGVFEVHVRSPGFVERVFVAETGVAVRRRQPLFTFYSPEIFQAQSELLAAKQWSSADHPASQVSAARRKLELLGMAERDIEQVMQTGQALRAVPIYAPESAFVIKKNLVQGAYLTPETVLYELRDLSHVYVLANLYQEDIAFVHKGSQGRFVPAQRPNDAIAVTVDLVYPTLNAEPRTTQVRMVVANPGGATFRPGEYGSVTLATSPRPVLNVPRDAVVDNGLSTYVFVVPREGTFSPREVVLGAEEGETRTVLRGLAAGDRVVSGATFLIDSESRLRAAASEALSPSQRESGGADTTGGRP
jgi:Cu(I)/Ag(I) efflux system membrane fusion protein